MANETGAAETRSVSKPAGVADLGLDGPVDGPAGAIIELQTSALAERCWKGRPEWVRVP